MPIEAFCSIAKGKFGLLFQNLIKFKFMLISNFVRSLLLYYMSYVNVIS